MSKITQVEGHGIVIEGSGIDPNIPARYMKMLTVEVIEEYALPANKAPEGTI